MRPGSRFTLGAVLRAPALSAAGFETAATAARAVVVATAPIAAAPAVAAGGVLSASFAGRLLLYTG